MTVLSFSSMVLSKVFSSVLGSKSSNRGESQISPLRGICGTDG